NALGLRIRNDTANLIGAVTVSYTGEQWRFSGTFVSQTLAFSYKTNSSPFTSPLDTVAAPNNGWVGVSVLDFLSPTIGVSAGPLDGNATTNRTIFSGVLLTGVTLSPGDELFLRWVDVDDPGSDHGLAIDDFSVSFTVLIPPTVSTLPAADGGPNLAILNGVANPNGVSLTVWFEYGSTTNYGNTTPTQPVGNGIANTTLTLPLAPA